MPLKQSVPKLKQVTTWLPVLSCALGSLVVFTLSSHWLSKVFSCLLIGCFNYFGFGFMTLI